MDLCGGSVKTSRSDLMPYMPEQIWERLEDVLVKTSKNMKEILCDVCGVKEEHPIMSLFLDVYMLLADLTKQYEEILKNLDNTLFIKETKFVAAKNTTNIGTK